MGITPVLTLTAGQDVAGLAEAISTVIYPALSRHGNLDLDVMGQDGETTLALTGPADPTAL